MAEIVVRVAELEDAAAMGRVHVRAWQAAYPGIMPDAFLAALDPDERATMWHDVIERNPRPSEGRRLVVELDGALVGLALVWPEITDAGESDVSESDAGEPTDAGAARIGELVLINLAPEAWGTGAGTQLLRACTDALRSIGYAEAVLWVAEGNARARRFYEREGWHADGTSRSQDVGTVVEELRYRISLSD